MSQNGMSILIALYKEAIVMLRGAINTSKPLTRDQTQRLTEIYNDMMRVINGERVTVARNQKVFKLLKSLGYPATYQNPNYPARVQTRSMIKKGK